MLAPESRLWRDDRARLGQDRTYGEVRFDLAETVRSQPRRTYSDAFFLGTGLQRYKHQTPETLAQYREVG